MKAKNENGKWEFPGGTVEFGDTMKDTIIREIKEEFGITIKLLYHMSPIGHIIPVDKQHWVTSTYISKIVNGTPQIMEPEKCDDNRWFSFEEIKKLKLSIATSKNLKKLEELDLQKFI